MDRLRGLGVEAATVVAGGGRLLGRHWPWLITIYLLGAAAHGGVLWLAVNVSKHHSTLAGLILPLAPIASLVALILMLRRLGPSLRFASFSVEGRPVVGSAGDEGGQGDSGGPSGESPARARFTSRATAQLSLVASLLVPFLTLYSTQGYLQEDRQSFINAAAFDESFANSDVFYGGTGNATRVLLASTTTAVLLVIVVALVLRRVFNALRLADRNVLFALIAAYIEVFWLFSAASYLDHFKSDARAWVRQRTAVDWVTTHFDSLVSFLGVVGRPLRAVDDAFNAVVTSSAAILVIPIAWLVVGAVVFGRKLDTATAPPLVVVPERVHTRVQRVRIRAERLPAPVRKVGRDLGGDVRNRFAALGDALRLLVVTGAMSVMLFCLVFFLARYGEFLMGELFRVVIGPRDLSTGLAFSPWVELATRGTYTVLLIVLVATAVDRVVGRQEARAAASPPVPAVQP
ncbi:hypothetical protein [Lapillicoccus sp.]|uniref:hypothetical protein n=1 Tax=Lapillicoccus sp. TaxID=1909287 RepID=UPI0025D5C262|nr:hypothetical protein [Lapillicoccus sp.]